MPIRLIVPLLFVLGLLYTVSLPAQSVAEMERQLEQTTAPEQQWELAFRISRNLLATDLSRAAGYADRSLQLALTGKDKKREAESAWMRADIAERQAQTPRALGLYHQAYDAAVAAMLPDLPVQAADKLQTVYARQQNFKEAYEWSRQRTALLQEKSRDHGWEASG